MDAVKKTAKGGFGFDLLEGAIGTGKSAAQRAQKAQTKAIAERQKKEDQLLAEGESEVKRRQALATKGKTGRKSLIATSETGLATNLGGS